VKSQQLTESSSDSLQASLQKNIENGTKSIDKLPDDLAAIVRAWPNLPEHIRLTIKDLINSQRRS